jgi:hypothetical protein
MEARQRLVGQLGVGADQGLQRAQAVGHVAGVLHALVGAAGPDVGAVAHGVAHQHGQRQVGQRAAAGLCRAGVVAFAHRVLLPGPQPVVVQALGQLVQHLLAHGVDALRVHLRQLFGHVAFGRRLSAPVP